MRDSNHKNISYRGMVLKKLSDFYRQKHSTSILVESDDNERTPINFNSDQMAANENGFNQDIENI